MTRASTLPEGITLSWPFHGYYWQTCGGLVQLFNSPDRIRTSSGVLKEHIVSNSVKRQHYFNIVQNFGLICPHTPIKDLHLRNTCMCYGSSLFTCTYLSWRPSRSLQPGQCSPLWPPMPFLSSINWTWVDCSKAQIDKIARIVTKQMFSAS